MNLHARILYQFPLFDIRFLIFRVEKPLNIPKLKKVMTYLFSFLFYSCFKKNKLKMSGIRQITIPFIYK